MVEYGRNLSLRGASGQSSAWPWNWMLIGSGPLKEVSTVFVCSTLWLTTCPDSSSKRKKMSFWQGSFLVPQEPSLDISSFLQPKVEELIPLRKGKRFTVCTDRVVNCHAMVMCVAVDIPASQKIGGFLGHQAERRCTKCLTSFLRAHFSEKPNYGGYIRKSWQERTNKDHRKSLPEKIWLASTETAKLVKNIKLVLTIHSFSGWNIMTASVL